MSFPASACFFAAVSKNNKNMICVHKLTWYQFRSCLEDGFSWGAYSKRLFLLIPAMPTHLNLNTMKARQLYSSTPSIGDCFQFCKAHILCEVKQVQFVRPFLPIPAYSYESKCYYKLYNSTPLLGDWFEYYSTIFN